MNHFINRQHIFTISQANELVRVALERIVYLVSEGSYSRMVLVDGTEHLFSFNLSRFQELVEQYSSDQAAYFIRVGRRLIINRTYIFCVQPTKQKLFLSGDRLSKTLILGASREALRQLKCALESQNEIQPY